MGPISAAFNAIKDVNSYLTLAAFVVAAILYGFVRWLKLVETREKAKLDSHDKIEIAKIGKMKLTVSDPATWTLTRDGLTITFGQYAIGPYALGMPEAHISWSDLKSDVASDLQPTTLPAPTPKPNP